MKTNKITPVLYVLLALALFVSSVAWAPFPAAQDDPDDPIPGVATGKWPPQYTRGRLSARIVGDQLLLQGERLPRQRDFFVKVRRSARYGWERMGVSNTDRHGNLEDVYRLPQKLRKLPAVQVCLKDVISNRAYCITARR